MPNTVTGSFGFASPVAIGMGLIGLFWERSVHVKLSSQEFQHLIMHRTKIGHSF